MPSVAGEIAECRRSIYTITLVTLGCAIFPHVAVCVYIIGIHAYACISQVACVHTCMYVKVVGRYRPIEHDHTCWYGWSGTQLTRQADQPASDSTSRPTGTVLTLPSYVCKQISCLWYSVLCKEWACASRLHIPTVLVRRYFTHEI